MSRSKQANTTSYGLLSNVPFEDEGGYASVGFVSAVVTLDADGDPIPECSKKEHETLIEHFKVCYRSLCAISPR